MESHFASSSTMANFEWNDRPYPFMVESWACLRLETSYKQSILVMDCHEHHADSSSILPPY